VTHTQSGVGLYGSEPKVWWARPDSDQFGFESARAFKPETSGGVTRIFPLFPRTEIQLSRSLKLMKFTLFLAEYAFRTYRRKLGIKRSDLRHESFDYKP
jgi:hypothetical protein